MALAQATGGVSADTPLTSIDGSTVAAGDVIASSWHKWEGQGNPRFEAAATSHGPGYASQRVVWTDADGTRRAMLPPAFVSALQMSAQDHMLMSAAVQPFTPSSSCIGSKLQYWVGVYQIRR